MTLLLLCAAAACSRKQEQPPGETVQVMEGFSMHQSVDGSPRWTLKASSAFLREDDDEADLIDPIMDFQKNGRLVSRTKALRGRVHTATRDVALSSSVVVESFEDGSVLKSETLDYSSKAELFLTQDDVVVTRPGGVLRGRGLKAKPDLSEISIFNQEAVSSAPSKR